MGESPRQVEIIDVLPRGSAKRSRSQNSTQTFEESAWYICERFEVQERESDWTKDNTDDHVDEDWTGRTIFIVGKQHSSDNGTDQRRQRVESLNH